jgi:hypothetical protein
VIATTVALEECLSSIHYDGVTNGIQRSGAAVYIDGPQSTTHRIRYSSTWSPIGGLIAGSTIEQRARDIVDRSRPYDNYAKGTFVGVPGEVFTGFLPSLIVFGSL